jgi:hypothetical protein
MDLDSLLISGTLSQELLYIRHSQKQKNSKGTHAILVEGTVHGTTFPVKVVWASRVTVHWEYISEYALSVHLLYNNNITARWKKHAGESLICLYYRNGK